MQSTCMYLACTLVNTVRIADVNYTGQICQFSETGVGEPTTDTSHPVNNHVVQWQTPDVNFSTGTTPATGDQLPDIPDS